MDLSPKRTDRVEGTAYFTFFLRWYYIVAKELYILDEPCKGLHYRDITKIVKATKDLIHRGNTVIAIEHNKQYISSSDCIVELGPVGGPDGGYLISQSSMPQRPSISLLLNKHRKRKIILKLIISTSETFMDRMHAFL